MKIYFHSISLKYKSNMGCKYSTENINRQAEYTDSSSIENYSYVMEINGIRFYFNTGTLEFYNVESNPKELKPCPPPYKSDTTPVSKQPRFTTII